jgi:hypothetical protein
MGMFSSARTNWRHSKERLPEFRLLAGTIGRPRAEAFLDLVYDTLNERGALKGCTDEAVGDLMTIESGQVNSRRAYVDSLWNRARVRALKPELTRDVMPRSDYYREDLLHGVAHGKEWKAVEHPGPSGKAEARKQAVFWICRRSPEDDKPVELQKVRAILKQYIPDTDTDGVLGPCLGRSSQVIRHIHKEVCPGVKGQRLEWAGAVRYPSTIGGDYLLDYIFQQTAGVRWPPFQDPHWVDAALFFLGAIGTVQSFKDGNKRVARIAYAIVLIKAGFVFKAPTPDLETRLFDMNLG